MFDIFYADDVKADLKNMKAHTRNEILDRIDEELEQQPTRETRNKKILRGLKPPWGQKGTEGACLGIAHTRIPGFL